MGINYAPEETGIAPYTTGVAEHLAGRGWNVTVITGFPHYPQWRAANEYRNSFAVRERRHAVDLRRVRQYTPHRQSALGRALYELSFFGQSLAQLTTTRPDCVVGVVPSLGGGVAAALHARRHRVPFGLILQDLVGQAAAQSGIPGGGVAAKPAQAVESWVLRQAHRVAVVAESFHPYLERAGVQPSRIRHLPNWSHVTPPTGRQKELRQRLAWPENRQVVLHAGNMGYKQGLDNVVETARVAAAEGLTTHFVLMGDGNDRGRLQALAADLPNIEFLDPQPGNVFMDILATADVLLLNERPTVIDMSLPSKITSYFVSGSPVIAAVAPMGSTAQELLRSGGALIVPAGEPTALISALRTIRDDPALGQRLITDAQRYAGARLDKATLLGRAEQFVRELSGLRPTPAVSTD